MKKLLAIVLFCAAVAIGAFGIARTRPPAPSPPPVASQIERSVQERLKADFQAKVKGLGLTADQEKRLEAWSRFRAEGKTAEERRAHNRELRNILTPEQFTAYQALQKERRAGEAALREAREARLRRMIGERDYEKHKSDMQKVREQRKQRLETRRAAGATPAPTPAPSQGAQSLPR